MKPFYEVASFFVNSEGRLAEFKNERHTWFRTTVGDPVLMSFTPTYSADRSTYHAEVKCYRRNSPCPSDRKVA